MGDRLKLPGFTVIQGNEFSRLQMKFSPGFLKQIQRFKDGFIRQNKCPPMNTDGVPALDILMDHYGLLRCHVHGIHKPPGFIRPDRDC